MAIRFCEDIGMYSLDRPREISCVHRTTFCEKTCYNNKLEKAFPKIHGRDLKNEAFWQNTDGPTMARILSRKKKECNKRIRLCTRGEPFATKADVPRVLEWAKACPDWTWWVPTRAWRNRELREFIEENCNWTPNLKIMASVDPSNTSFDLDDIYIGGWTMLYYGDDEPREGFFLCPKTWKKLKGHCAICKAGCFSGKTDVHLKQH